MLRYVLLLFAIFSFCIGCARFKADNPTDDFDEGERIVKLKNPTLKEISGMVSSVHNQGLLWVHNDSGDEPRIFLIDKNLKIVLTCSLANCTNRDWEDIAIGPGPVKGKTYLYIGEIGDNAADYQYKTIYRLEEPIFDGKTSELTVTEIDKLTFELAGKKKDTETLLIDPLTRDLFVVSKREEPVWLYRIPYPQNPGDTIEATKEISLPFTQIVGGDISKDGKSVLLKNYEHVYYWNNRPDGSSITQLLAQKPYEVPYEPEPQGEAITWAADNSGFYTLSEKNIGKETYLYYYQSRLRRKN